MSKRIQGTFLAFLLLVTGCSGKTLTDPTTKIDVEVVSDITSDMIVIHAMNDEMDRGNLDFFDKDIVVEPRYYDKHPIKRGEIITYKGDWDEGIDGITRVIAFEGDNVKISTAQFYINGKKLDTFYGRAHRLGKDLNQLKNELEKGDFEASHIEQNVKNMVEYFQDISEEEITVPEGFVYVTGDDWFRSGTMGVLPIENITGKLIGYK